MSLRFRSGEAVRDPGQMGPAPQVEVYLPGQERVWIPKASHVVLQAETGMSEHRPVWDPGGIQGATAWWAGAVDGRDSSSKLHIFEQN